MGTTCVIIFYSHHPDGLSQQELDYMLALQNHNAKQQVSTYFFNMNKLYDAGIIVHPHTQMSLYK